MPSRNGAVHVATTRRRYKGKIYETHLLRRTFREDGKVKHQTLGNLSHLPSDLLDFIRGRLRGDIRPWDGGGDFEILRSFPHGHVAAVVGTLRRIQLDTLIASRTCRERDLIVAMIAARVIEPCSKLATARGLREHTASTSLCLEMEIDPLSDRELYQSLDWLVQRQWRIEDKLAKRHLQSGCLILYDVTSSYYTGSCCNLAKFGHNRDGKKGFPQIVYGVLCNDEGCPVAIEVFEGNTGDQTTLRPQIEKIRRRFGLNHVVLVGDRGMLTSKRIDEELRTIDGLDWITALRAKNIKKLVDQNVVELSLFDQRDLLEVKSPDYPSERLIVCRNPLLAEERSRKREALLKSTEKELDKIASATRRSRRPLRGKDKIGLRVGKFINRFKVAKHFDLDIKDDHFSYRRNENKIKEEAMLDGLYVIRTSTSKRFLDAEDTVRAYKDLAKVERAFRCLKTIDLKIRPIFHWTEDRVRAHVFLCMLAYYVEWHMREKLAPILFDDDDKELAETLRESIVTPAQRSPTAKAKDQTKRTEDGLPVHSFQSLLDDLGTLAKNRVRVTTKNSQPFYVLTQPTEVQQRAFDYLEVVPTA